MKWNEESVKRGDGGGRRRRSEEGSSPGECVNHAGDAYQHCDGGCGSQTTLGTTVCVCGNPRECGYGTSERGPLL